LERGEFQMIDQTWRRPQYEQLLLVIAHPPEAVRPGGQMQTRKIPPSHRRRNAQV
jgi:hypothetical protein